MAIRGLFGQAHWIMVFITYVDALICVRFQSVYSANVTVLDRHIFSVKK